MAGGAGPDSRVHTQDAYDGRGNLVESLDEEGNRTTYEYGTSGGSLDRVVREIDPRSANTYRSYDASGNLVSERRDLDQGVQSLTVWGYDGGLLTREETRISNDATAVTTYSDFAPNAEPQEVRRLGVKCDLNGPAETVIERTEYDAFGNVVRRVDPRGTATQTDIYRAPARLALVESTDATGTRQLFTRDSFGHVTKSRRMHGTEEIEKVEYSVSAKGEVLIERHFLDGRWAYTATNTIDFDGRVSQSDHSVEGRTSRWYNPAGLVVREFGAEVPVGDQGDPVEVYYGTKSTRHRYDAAGRLVSTVLPGKALSEATTNTLSPTGRVSRVDAPDGTWTEYEYDSTGNTTMERRPTTDGGVVTDSYGYDLGGRRTSVVKTEGSEQTTTSYTYDLLGREVGAQLGEPSSKEYNTLGWVIKETDFDNIVTTRSHDLAGNVETETIGGKSTRSSYDEFGRVVTRTDPSGRNVTYRYDLFGRVVGETHRVPGADEPVKNVETAYDALSRAVASTDTVTGVRTTLAYATPARKVTTQTVSYAETISTILYDANGRELSRETTMSTSATLTLSVLERTTDGLVTSRQVGALSAISSYDAEGRLATQGGSGWQGSGAAYAYEADHKVSESAPISWAPSAYTQTYAYSDAGRLSRVTSGTVSWDYGFDELGNLTSVKPSSAATTTLAYDMATSRLLNRKLGASVAATYTFDSLGRRVNEGPTTASKETTCTWDEASRLTGYSKGATSAQYRYDGNGQRTGATVTVPGASTVTTYTYDGLSLLSLAASSSAGDYKITYLYDENARAYAVRYTSGTAEVVFHLLTNDRGDALGLLDEAGNQFAAYRYDAFGNPLAATSQAAGAIGAELAAAITERQPLRYAGYAYDAHSQLYYLSQRYYDPATF